MKTLKKLFSVSAIVALLGTLVPMYAFAANYSDELQEAYAYAYTNGITTMKSIDAADMYGSLTRVAMAKMIANYATTVLGLEPDTSAKCTFTDVTAALDAQYDNGVTKACQLGLMGQNITAFRPNDLVTRAEFGTTLSRALNANSDDLEAMNAANPYYKDHLNFLKAEGIMNQIDNPSMTEVRGYVMLMMMRADEGYTPNEKCSLEEMVACALADDTDACLAACTGNEEEDPQEVKAGTLKVTMTSEEGRDIPLLASALPVVSYNLKSVDEDIEISSLTLEQVGYGKATTLDGIALFINGKRVSSSVNPTINQETVLNLKDTYVLKAGKSVDFEVKATIGAAAAASEQFAIKLNKVESSAEKVNLPSNATSNTFKLVDANAASIVVANGAGTYTPKAGTKGAKIFDFDVTNSDVNQDVELNSIMFVGNDKDMEDNLQKLELVVNNKVVATAEMDGKYLTFNLSEPFTIEKNSTESFTVKADVLGGADETAPYKFDIVSVMDISATAVSYQTPANVNASSIGSYPAAGFTVSAGKITLSRTNPTTTTFYRNEKKAYLGSFTIENNAGTDMHIDSLKLTLTKDAGQALTNYVSQLYVRYGSKTASLRNMENTANDKVTWTLDQEQNIGKSLTVYVYADFLDTNDVTAADRFTMSIAAAADLSIKDSDDTDVSEGISPKTWSQMKGSSAALDVTNVNLAAKKYDKGSDGIEAMTFKLKTTDVSDINVSKVVYKSTPNTISENEIESAKMYVNDKSYDVEINAGSIIVSEAITLEKNTTSTIKLVIDLTDDANGTIVYSLDSIYAKDSDNNTRNYTTAINGRTITIQSAGEASIYANNEGSNKVRHSILAGEESDVAEFQLQAKYEVVNADSFEVTFANNINSTLINNIQLLYSGEVIAEDPTITTNTAKFENVNLDILTEKKALVIKVLTNSVESNLTDIANKVTKLTITEAYGKDSGDPITIAAKDSAAREFDVVPAKLTVTRTSTSNTETVLNVKLDKGENTDGGSDFDVYVTDFVLASSSIIGKDGLQYATLKHEGEDLVKYEVKTSCTSPEQEIGAAIGGAKVCMSVLADNLSDLKLVDGDNEFTLNYFAGEASNPAYTIKLEDIKYVTSLTHTIPTDATDVAGLLSLANQFLTRMDVLDLVTRG